MKDLIAPPDATILLVGDTKTGKTLLLTTWALYLFKHTGKKFRLYSSDAGSMPDLTQAAIDKGIIQLWRMRSRDPSGRHGLPTATCDKATQGYWPAAGLDPKTGLAPECVEMLAPTLSTYVMVSKAGGVVSEASAPELLQPGTCPITKELVLRENCKAIEKRSKPAPGFADVAGMGFDSVSSMADWCRSDMDTRAGNNELGGEKGNMATQLSDGISYGVGNRASVGFVQSRSQDWFYNVQQVALPAPAVLTALELRATDEGGVPVYGPKAAGRAKTSEIPSWVACCLGTVAVVNAAAGTTEYRLYLRSYKDPNNPADQALHLCGIRSMPGPGLPDYLTDGPHLAGQLPRLEKYNLGTFMDLLGEARKRAEAFIDGYLKK